MNHYFELGFSYMANLYGYVAHLPDYMAILYDYVAYLPAYLASLYGYVAHLPDYGISPTGSKLETSNRIETRGEVIKTTTRRLGDK